MTIPQGSQVFLFCYKHADYFIVTAG